MAERRMFAKTIIDSDAFLDMPSSSQNLYFHLSMRADDDGFVNNPKKIQRMVASSEDDLKLLVAKSFIIPFDSGIVVIKHWRICNYLRSDRYKPTVYQDEINQLEVKENGAYTFKSGIPMVAAPVYQRETQVSIGKVSIGKDREEPPFSQPEPKQSFESFCQFCVNQWTQCELKPSFRFTTSLGLTSKEREGFSVALQRYQCDEIEQAMNNYRDILNSQAHDAFPSGYSLAGFLGSGISQYLDESNPFERCKKKPDKNEKISSVEVPSSEETREHIERLREDEEAPAFEFSAAKVMDAIRNREKLVAKDTQ